MLHYSFYVGVYPLLLVLSIYLGKKTHTRIDKYRTAWRPIGLESSLIGFYALLASFTLAQSGNSARDREQIIHTVADDISVILRVSSIDEPTLYNKVQVYFSDFTKIIKQPIKPDQQSIKSSIEAIHMLDDSLNNFMKLYVQQNPSMRQGIGTLLSQVDAMESNYYRLLHSFQRRLPSVILFVLIFFSILIAYLMGYMEKSSGNNFRISTIIFFVMSIIIINIIHDLDDPSFGFLTPNLDDIIQVIGNFHVVK